MSQTTNPNALAGLGIGDLHMQMCGNPVARIALGDDPMNARSRAALAGGGS